MHVVGQRIGKITPRRGNVRPLLQIVCVIEQVGVADQPGQADGLLAAASAKELEREPMVRREQDRERLRYRQAAAVLEIMLPAHELPPGPTSPMRVDARIAPVFAEMSL